MEKIHKFILMNYKNKILKNNKNLNILNNYTLKAYKKDFKKEK